MANTAVVRVFPSPKGWICQIPDIKLGDLPDLHAVAGAGQEVDYGFFEFHLIASKS